MTIKEELQGKNIIIPDNPVANFFFNNTRSGLIWLITDWPDGTGWTDGHCRFLERHGISEQESRATGPIF